MKKTFTVTITVRSEFGEKPVVQALLDDMVMLHLIDGQSARWTIKEKKSKKKSNSFNGLS